MVKQYERICTFTECIIDNGDSLIVPSGSYTFVMDGGEFDIDKTLLAKAIDGLKLVKLAVNGEASLVDAIRLFKKIVS